MKQVLFVLLAVVLSISTKAGNGHEGNTESIAGVWKLTDVQITSLGTSENVATKENCYLCDLYKSKEGLVFTEDGKVSYTNYSNSNDVRYEVRNGILSMYADVQPEQITPETSSMEGAPVRTSVEFNMSLVNGVLTLTRAYSGYIETYTFTK